MDDETRALLSEDVDQIREGLSSFAEYDFSKDLQQHMDEQALSALSLGARCLVSHTMIDKWRLGKARPNGKERMKELGMALCMDESQLNIFLYQNGYPMLYAKNPLDSAAKLLLLNGGGREDIVIIYRELIERLGLENFVPAREIEPLKTFVLSGQLKDAAENGQISGWFRAHEKHFAGGVKTQMPDLRIIRFLMLFIGELSIHEMVVTGEIPAMLKGLLYDLSGGRAVSIRGLREKLIVFGLFSNMTEEEIDTLLDYARLRPLSEPATLADFSVLSALRTAHERYPHYENDNLSRIMKRLSSPQDDYDRSLAAEYQKRLENAAQRASYYDHRQRTREETLFEQRYTAYSDHCVIDFVFDLLLLLEEAGELTTSQVKPFTMVLQKTREGESLWN